MPAEIASGEIRILTTRSLVLKRDVGAVRRKNGVPPPATQVRPTSFHEAPAQGSPICLTRSSRSVKCGMVRSLT